MIKLCWSYHPYVPFRVRAEKKPHVLSVRPFKEGFSFEWCDMAEKADCGYTLKIRRRYSDEVMRLPDGSAMRNILSLARSHDLFTWEKVKTVVDCSGYNKWETGFQYPSMMIEKNNIIIISRTAYNGAHSFHDSNMITFHRVEI